MMENRQQLQGWLQKLQEYHAKAELAEYQFSTGKNDDPENDMALKYECYNFVERADEAYNNILEMFDRERARVEKLTEWLTATTKVTAEMASAINGRVRE